jgi:Yip1 domain
MELGTRIKNILVSPRTEWRVIAAEPWDAAALYRSYVMPLAAIPTVCGLVGAWFLLQAMHLGFGRLLASAIAGYLITLATVYILGLVFSRLAPTFGGRQDDLMGLKLAAFAGTSSWVGGVFLLIPVLGWLIALLMTLYGLYLLYTGAPVLMRIPEDRTMPYTVAVIIAAIVVTIVLRVIVGLLFIGQHAF